MVPLSSEDKYVHFISRLLDIYKISREIELDVFSDHIRDVLKENGIEISNCKDNTLVIMDTKCRH